VWTRRGSPAPSLWELLCGQCAAGPAAGTAETAAYLTAKAAVLEAIAAEREAGGWSPEDAEAARDAAARARQAAGTAAMAERKNIVDEKSARIAVSEITSD
jgi:hypothetical protein